MPPILTRTETDVPRGDRATEPLLRIAGLKTHFETADGVVKAVDGVDVEVGHGQTVCVVGESGCGKSMTARSILQLIERPGRIVDGSVQWRPDPEAAEPVEVTGLHAKDPRLTSLRGGEIGMIFQEPLASLSPMYTVGEQLMEPLRIHQGMTKSQARERAIDLLRTVGIPKPEQRVDSYPFQLSGGMCQRVMIAIAISCEPKLLIADEPTTALDVTTQARILELLGTLQAENGMSILFITHDLGVVAEIADRVVVMYAGRAVEEGDVKEIFANPQMPYTLGLMNSIPRVDKAASHQARLEAIPGNVPNPLYLPEGCAFNPRCQFAEPKCREAIPPLEDTGGGHMVRCVRWNELELEERRVMA